ncbi:MAG: TraR/DksA family transcriptional regulator [Nitrospinota bacterium]|nr:TraR/DksA family transcriptional regulator [Nitrospinota bacterium]
MATKKKTVKKKTGKKKAPVKKKVAKKKMPTKKKVSRKATKKKAPVKKKAAKKKMPAKKKTIKKTKKTSTPKAKKKLVKKKTTKKPSPTKKVKKASKKPPSKVASKKKAASSKKVEVTKPKKSKALPKLGPETMKIKERLMGKRNELLKLIQSSKSLERDIGDITFSNEIDLASSLEGREMVFQLTSRDRNELRLIEEAVFRINEGTYGACESCEKKISLKRLQIMPLTSLCIECQEAAENL